MRMDLNSNSGRIQIPITFKFRLHSTSVFIQIPVVQIPVAYKFRLHSNSGRIKFQSLSNSVAFKFRWDMEVTSGDFDFVTDKREVGSAIFWRYSNFSLTFRTSQPITIKKIASASVPAPIRSIRVESKQGEAPTQISKDRSTEQRDHRRSLGRDWYISCKRHSAALSEETRDETIFVSHLPPCSRLQKIVCPKIGKTNWFHTPRRFRPSGNKSTRQGTCSCHPALFSFLSIKFVGSHFNFRIPDFLEKS